MRKWRNMSALGGLGSDRGTQPPPMTKARPWKESAVPRLAAACSLVAIPGAAACLVYVATSAHPIAQASEKDEPAFASDVREVELSAVYSTSGQKKLEPVYRHLAEKSPERKAFESIDDALRESRSPPLLAVVRGDDIKEAVLATARFIRLKEAPARPIGPDDKGASKKHWLFVHIAHTGSSPPQWIVYPPTVFGKRVRFSYTRFDGWFTPDPGEGWTVTADDHAYFYWVPLGVFEETDQVRAELVELSKTVKASYPAKKK